ncbi:major facilitator superfamily domain-containing protein [Aspergillus pseudonomiae]|uniref:Major facilitator superfamily domain-containing protein n=1 Tax=Aspergillus pseudonomiae TaxID=1506151 RepID=A0A5N7CRL0_9EURO|nr:major facilitator superfamily domain-containing protein [Aspergillus pseudonomiae]KAB8259021.1 major facilitator superfamily domain-containing protein [Aspergillus pseudonomiae]KAE8396826.1 major facilitator superfamily domain-containing protein [Aspergillus pseudonomiae]
MFFNPFKKHDHDFPDVVVPLGSAPAHSHPNPALHTKDSGPDEKSDARSDKAPSEENGVATSLSDNAHLTIESLRAEVESDIVASGHDSAYDRKAKVINRAIQDIGMGRYQWELFALCGCGWLADNLWLQGVALTLTQLSAEFGVSESRVRFTTCALFLGLCLGASFWGVASDIIGRRPAFNLTLLITSVFGLAAGGGPNWVGVCALFACLGLGVGGNLPVDGALFLEFLPFASGNLLTMLSVWWPIGNLISSLLAWAYIPTYSCASDLPACNSVADGVQCCTKQDNMGWRYLVLTLGALTFAMFFCRFFLFHLYESPKYLLSRGRQAEAVHAVHGIAHKNKKQTWLTEDILNEIGGYPEQVAKQTLTFKEIIVRYLSKFSLERIKPLFGTKKLGINTVLLWFCWATIGMGYPLFNAFLPQYLKQAGGGAEQSTYIVYRNYAITSIVGVPGSVLACFTVDIKYVGRKGTMIISTMITGVLLFCFTATTDPNIQLLCSSLEAFFQNIMYGVLYAYTPEVFPAPNRGTGTGIASCLNRIAGLCAPLVAIYSGSANPNAPIYASGALMLASFVAMCLFPIETRGKQTL